MNPMRAQDLRMLRSVSGPSGKVENNKFVFDEVRNRFVYPQDKSFTVYFEWVAPAGMHVLTGIWKQPDGTVATMSPDVKIQAPSRELNCYWTFVLYDGMRPGIWNLEVRIDGQPAGSHPFEIVGPPVSKPAAEPEPAQRRAPTVDDIYRSASPSLVWIYKVDQAGRRTDTASGFVIGKDRIVTAFQAVDACESLEVEFSGGRKAVLKELLAWSRSGDWAVLAVATGSASALEIGKSKDIQVGERLIVFNVEGSGRVIGGIDIAGRQNLSGFGERIQLSPALTAEAAGGPLLDLYGRVVGIIGGSTVPGARFNRRDMSVSPSLWNSLTVQNKATPLTALNFSSEHRPSLLSALLSTGELTAPIHPMPEFLYGGTALAIAKDLAQPASQEVSEFSRKDPQVWVYTMWAQKGKVSKGMISARVYDEQNRLRVTVPPKKVSLYSTPTRSAFSFVPATLNPGVYRIDLIWDNRPAWRTFIRITD